ncbi:MAG: RNA-guided endonuclease InsQ/TnpB family protein [Candidatus Kariarchaeaceae archaeon]
MKINRAYKVEMKPNNKQLTLLKKAAGIARFAYNWGLADKQYRYKNLEGNEKYTNAIKQHKEINKLKDTKFPWMREVSKCVPQEALRDLDQGFSNFFAGIHSFPKFKKKGKTKDSFRLTGSIIIHPEGKHKSCKLKKANKNHVCSKSCKIKHSAPRIQLPRLKTIKIKEIPNFKKNTKILSATVSRIANKWFVSLTVEEEFEPKHTVQKELIAYDLGLIDLAISSEGKRIANHKPLKTRLKALRRTSKSVSRKIFKSNNWQKSKKKLAKFHHKITNIRKDTLHKFTSSAVDLYEVIVIEDLNTKGMIRNKKLSRAIADVGWGELKRQLKYKAKLADVKLVIAPRFFPSSKLCSRCWTKKLDLKLSDRTYVCEKCGLVIDRDDNAALNLEIYGKMYLIDPSVAASWLETLNACGEGVRPFDAFLSLLPDSHPTKWFLIKEEQMIEATSKKQEEVERLKSY